VDIAFYSTVLWPLVSLPRMAHMPSQEANDD